MQAGLGEERRGPAWRGRAGQGTARPGAARLVAARLGATRLGKPGCGSAWRAWLGKAGQGVARPGHARPGMAGTARRDKARPVPARLGQVRRDTAGTVQQGKAGPSTTRHDMHKRINISIPMPLYEAMRGLSAYRNINWSAVAARAFRQELIRQGVPDNEPLRDALAGTVWKDK